MAQEYIVEVEEMAFRLFKVQADTEEEALDKVFEKARGVEYVGEYKPPERLVCSVRNNVPGAPKKLLST